ncbi:hypothetical protein DENSPDRAFT_165621 [Dentipellis sp. KUC8613]|nr:hypothetical protein DENSPDRAFT_165621 [Dentipellis sp. KUC8613]
MSIYVACTQRSLVCGRDLQGGAVVQDAGGSLSNTTIATMVGSLLFFFMLVAGFTKVANCWRLFSSRPRSVPVATCSDPLSSPVYRSTVRRVPHLNCEHRRSGRPASSPIPKPPIPKPPRAMPRNSYPPATGQPRENGNQPRVQLPLSTPPRSAALY